jgi:hypothetical protein
LVAIDRDVAAAAAAANAAAMRTPFEDDEDAAGGNTSFNSASGPAMTQYGGYYASGSGPGGYDYEQQGGYDPYAAAAGGSGAAALGAVAGHHDDPYQDQPNLASNQNQYYLDPNEYDYDKASRSEQGYTYESGPYSDVPLAAGGTNYMLSRQDSEGSVGEHADEQYNNRRGALKVSPVVHRKLNSH